MQEPVVWQSPAAHNFSAVQGSFCNVRDGIGRPVASGVGAGGSPEVRVSCDTALQSHELLQLVGPRRIHGN